MSDEIQNTPVHPDAKQDYDEICRVVEQRLIPVFEVLGQMLHALDERIEDTDDVVHRIVGGFADAVGNHKRGELGEMLQQNFGEAIDTLNPLFSDMGGKSYADTLIDTLMEGEGEPDMDEIADRISGDLDKYGKYLGIEPEEAEEGSEIPEGEMAEGEIEEPEEGEKPEGLETGMDRLVRVNLGNVLGAPKPPPKPMPIQAKERGSDKMKKYRRGTDEARDKRGEFESKHEAVEAKDRAEGKERGSDKMEPRDKKGEFESEHEAAEVRDRKEGKESGADKIRRRLARGADKAEGSREEEMKEAPKKSNIINLGDFTDDMARKLAEFSHEIAKKHAR